jgi:hypothetical protein
VDDAAAPPRDSVRRLPPLTAHSWRSGDNSAMGISGISQGEWSVAADENVGGSHVDSALPGRYGEPGWFIPKI